jgi:hypothetical protein
MKIQKKVVLGLIIFGLIGITACIAVDLSSGAKPIIPNSSVEYHTKEELTDLYWQNKTVLNAVKESVISSKPLLRALDEYNEGDIAISYQSDKEYFSDEEWENIVTVFEKLHPSTLMLERKGRPLVFYVTFRNLKPGLESKVVYLYWFPNEEEREYHEKPGVFPDGVFTQLEEGWYIVEGRYIR